MREIDTEAPVVWPAWCYSGNTDESTIEVITRKGELDSDIVRQISNSTTEASGKARIRNRSANARRQARNTAALQEGTYSEKVHYNSQDGAAQLATPAPYSLNKTLLVDKMLSDRMLVGFNVVDNNKKHCDSNPSNILFDKVKNEAQMDPAKNGELGNNNNNNSSSNNNNNNSSSNNNNNNGSSSNNSSSSIKRERLSPPTNGDVQSSISRSRSATPSSFPGTPPQPAHPNDLSGSSLSANILSSVQARSNEFQTRNYSDFMRSLAAKYNNNNPNDSSVQRNMLFEAKYAASKSSIKESPSPPENKRQNMPNFNPPQVANVPFVSSLLSSLPFPPAVFPPVFDMSSTQALVTLARAAKEAEIQSIIKTAQKRPAAVQSVSPSNRTSLTPTPQPASSSSVRQFSPQPFVLPGQFHQQTIQPRQPSPLSTPVSSQSTDTVPASPLDLSATQQTKRVKLEEPSSPSSSPKRDLSLHRKSPKMEIAAEQKEVSTTPVRHCQAQSEEVNCWTVDDVCEFVGSIDICAEYAKNFRDQCIDGSGLPLLTEDHLTNSLGMKLGPALKLRSILAKKLGGPCPCVSCTIITQQQQSQHLVASATAASSSTVIPSSNSSSTSSSSSLVNISQQQQGGYTASSSNNQSSTSCSNIPRPTSTDSGS